MTATPSPTPFEDYPHMRPEIARMLTDWGTDYTPQRYGDFENPVQAILNGIKGELRREMAQDFIGAGDLDPDELQARLGTIDPAILGESIDPSFTRNLTAIHGPQWMGGETLPDLKAGELEIARVVVNSVLLDVYSLRARHHDGQYHISLVDDNGGRYSVLPETWPTPLSLKQVIAILETAEMCEFMGRPTTPREADDPYLGLGRVEGYWYQQWLAGDPLEDCTDFALVTSEVYPELVDWFWYRGCRWIEEHEKMDRPEEPSWFDEEEVMEDEEATR